MTYPRQCPTSFLLECLQDPNMCGCKETDANGSIDCVPCEAQ